MAAQRREAEARAEAKRVTLGRGAGAPVVARGDGTPRPEKWTALPTTSFETRQEPQIAEGLKTMLCKHIMCGSK